MIRFLLIALAIQSLIGQAQIVGSASITFISSVSNSAPGTGTITSNNGGPSSNGRLNVLSGDKLIVFCRSGGANNTFTPSDLGGDSFSSLTHENDAQVGNTQLFYVASAIANSADTFTCANSNSASGSEIIAMQFRGGPTSLDTQLQGALNSQASLTTGTFSTTSAIEIITLCGGTDGNSTFTVGAIGGTTATLAQLPGQTDAACEYVITSAIQSSITAAMSISPTHSWNWGLGAFK